MSAGADARAIEAFWAQNQPGFRFSSAQVGSREFFEDVQRHRYALEPHIREIADFDAWAGKDVLEAGCGIATDGLSLARAGARYTGVDYTAAAVMIARARFEQEGVEGATFVQASNEHLPFDDESFDLVYSHGVIHHMPNTERAVAEFHRVLRPGGTALVMVYHRNSLNYAVNILLIRRALAAALAVPGVAVAAKRFAAAVAHEDPAVIEGHRRLFEQHGLRYLRDRSLFLANNTDGPGNPLSKVYTDAEARELFGAFARVETAVRFLNLRLYPGGTRLATTRLARRAEKRWGWHLYVRALKGAPSTSS